MMRLRVVEMRRGIRLHREKMKWRQRNWLVVVRVRVWLRDRYMKCCSKASKNAL